MVIPHAGSSFSTPQTLFEIPAAIAGVIHKLECIRQKKDTTARANHLYQAVSPCCSLTILARASFHCGTLEGFLG